MIRLLRMLGLLTKEEAGRLRQSSIPLRTSAVLNSAVTLAALAGAALYLSYHRGLFSPSPLPAELPPSREAPTAWTVEEDLSSAEREARHAYRAKVDQLMTQLNVLQANQTKLEAELQDKTVETAELINKAQLLRMELRFKEREIAALSELAGVKSAEGRRFIRGTTQHEPSPVEAKNIPGFVANQDPKVKIMRATTPSEFPADLVIDLTPRSALPGDPYKLRVTIHNRGNQSIELTALDLIWSYAGRRTGGSVPFRPRLVKPRSTMVLHDVDGVWLEEHNSATITATVTLGDGGRLTNTLSWQDG